MSWQSYVDDQLIATGKIAKAAILGQAGGVWAASVNYTLSVDEQKAIVAAFKDPSAAQASGIRAGGQKFFTVQAEPERVYGKKMADGILCVKTTQAVLVAEYKGPEVQQGEAAPVVEKLADYLKSVGY